MDPKTRNVVALATIIALVAVSWWLFWPLNTKVTQGLDIKGGVQVILTAKPIGNNTLDESAMSRTEAILTERVNGLGVSEASVQRQGNDSMLVQLPGIKNSEDALAALGSTGRLDFVDLRSIATSENLAYGVKVPVASYDASSVVVAGSSVKSAGASIDAQNQPAVSVEFDKTGTDAWGAYTTANVGQYVVILLDNVVQSVAQIREPIIDGSTQISGSFDAAEAKRLSAVLQAGALPVELEPSSTQIVGPTLGGESLRQGLLAGLIGLGLVIVFMIVYYRGLGILSLLSLGTYLSLLFGVVALLSRMGAFALTLPGIAGLVLTVGLAADSSILIFERFKEEVRMGKTYRTAAKSGTRHAIGTSLDADLVTFVSAIVLFIVAIGPVKGFALTLMLGIACDLTVAILFTRTAVILLAENVIPKAPWLFGLKGGDINA
ncbi:MAG: protein translocase subunit SecD [Actinobacteria bacterium HGW-Actinobacteria-6]|jgi:preprotein translocase subunit SecD/SecD/SecF fusion protein|nr:MAG: protein translocase subunit SecD [Actinobacteria bacterium HGW-Actinobacteria-6]